MVALDPSPHAGPRFKGMVLQHPRAGFPSHALEFKHCLIWCSARRWVDPSGQTSPASTDADCPAHETDNEHRHLPLCLRVAAARNRTFRCPDRRRRNLRRGSAYHLTTQLPGTSFVIRRVLAEPGGRIAIPVFAPTVTSTPSAIASSRGSVRRLQALRKF